MAHSDPVAGDGPRYRPRPHPDRDLDRYGTTSSLSASAIVPATDPAFQYSHGSPVPIDRANRSIRLLPPMHGVEPAGPRRVLVIDDEPTVRDVLSLYLERDGYRVDVAPDGETARRLIGHAPDLVLLDLTVPGMDGLSFLRDVRQASDVPVIVLTARTDEIDRVLGLELGADDYVGKPFSPRELSARIRCVLRRGRAVRDEPRLEFDGLAIDAKARIVHVDGHPVAFRAREFDLLLFLASSPRQVFSRGQLLQHVWDSSAEFSDVSTVTVHVRRIRQKIEGDPLLPRWICTVRGVGYRFDP